MLRRLCFAATILSAVLVLEAGVAPCYAEQSFLITHRVIPNGFESEAHFLELLKWPSPPEAEFRASDAPHWDTSALAQFFGDAPVIITNVNDSSTISVAKRDVISSLSMRNGRVFAAFSHLSHIYSIPYKQYSELRFTRPTADLSVVEVSTWYRLTFQRTSSGPKLIRLDYLALEGE